MVGAVESLLYAVRYVYGITDLPYGSLSLNRVYVNERREIYIGLPLLRNVVRQRQMTVENDLKQLNAIIMGLADRATKSTTQRELRLCGLLCLSQSNVKCEVNVSSVGFGHREYSGETPYALRLPCFQVME